MTELTWELPGRPTPGGRSTPRLAWLPPAIRRPLVWLYRGARAAPRRVRGWRGRKVVHRTYVQAALVDASLVIAESVDVAMATVGRGVPGRKVWALALPAERLNGREQAGFAVQVSRAGGVLAGFITDSDDSRDSLERAMAKARPKIQVYPPVAVDRQCPRCVAGEQGADQQTVADPTADVPPPAAQLALWAKMIGGSPDSIAMENVYSFAAARFRGEVGRWAAPPRSGWQAPATHSRPAPPDAAGPPIWSAGAQVRAATRLLDTIASRPPRQARPGRSALVAGFDLKFARDLADRLDNRTDLAVTVDEWRGLAKGTDLTGQRLSEAESIFAEWARTSAVWYAQRKRPDQFLAVRLHRFELDAPYPRELAIENVDAVVYIAPLFGRRIRDELGWPVEKLVYIPNFLDLDWLDRPKLPEARFAIGLVGIEWGRKRFDLALDLLAGLRREDPRFRLIVRSVMPWHNTYASADADERDYAGRCFERLEQDPLLRHAVVFDEPGRDMARWFRRVGFVLSTSDEEGCHTSVGEGMASGAVPIVRPWPGAAEIYDKQWVHESVDEAVEAVLATVEPDTWAERGAQAKAEILQSHNAAAVVEAWADLLHCDIDRARSHFAAYSNLMPGGPTTS